jgi:septal ring factor EnvC (AmiA/AmiB activator)
MMGEKEERVYQTLKALQNYQAVVTTAIFNRKADAAKIREEIRAIDARLTELEKNLVEMEAENNKIKRILELAPMPKRASVH